MTHQTQARGADLADLIVKRYGANGVGSRLPTERSLSDELGVSRSTIRRALGLLEARRIISREVGRGTFFVNLTPVGAEKPGEKKPQGPSPEDISPTDVMTARWLLEPRIMTLVVSAATERDFAEMERCLAGGDAAANGQEFEAWDLALHRALAEASHNTLVIGMYGSIDAARHGSIWEAFKRRSDSVERRRVRAEEHLAIVEALRSRNAHDSVAAMERHLQRVEANMFGDALRQATSKGLLWAQSDSEMQIDEGHQEGMQQGLDLMSRYSQEERGE
ncbi:MAG TPA: FCD domain-containing protein [Trebonia sp.]